MGPVLSCGGRRYRFGRCAPSGRAELENRWDAPGVRLVRRTRHLSESNRAVVRVRAGIFERRHACLWSRVSQIRCRIGRTDGEWPRREACLGQPPSHGSRSPRSTSCVHGLRRDGVVAAVVCESLATVCMGPRGITAVSLLEIHLHVRPGRGRYDSCVGGGSTLKRGESGMKVRFHKGEEPQIESVRTHLDRGVPGHVSSRHGALGLRRSVFSEHVGRRSVGSPDDWRDLSRHRHAGPCPPRTSRTCWR